MNIKEIAEQAGFNDFPDDKNGVWITDGYWDEQLENFAALIRQDEAQACAKHYVDIMRDAVEQAVAKEREACAEIARFARMNAISDAIMKRGRTE